MRRKTNMDKFLPDDYKVPTGPSRYMRLDDGKNKLRILGSFENGEAIMGTEYWKTKEDGKRTPVRLKMGVSVPVEELELNSWGEPDIPKHFWAMPVFNYQEKAVQILEITQKGIMSTIKNLAQDEDWGTPLDYDITINRSGEKLKTEYTVTPSPKKEVEPEILAEYQQAEINIQALYEGGDPFSKELKLDKTDLGADFEANAKPT